MAKVGELLGNLDLQPSRRRLALLRIAHPIGQVSLTGSIGIRLVMRIAAQLAVADFYRQLGRRIAQVLGYRARFVLGDESARLAIRVVDGIRIGGTGKLDDGLGQCQFAFGLAQALIGFGGI
jgi:hypothetical protein